MLVEFMLVLIQLTNIFLANTKNACICRCHMDTACITTNFIGINETCV